MDDGRLVAACPQTDPDAAVPIEDAIAAAARRLTVEHDAGGVSAAALGELEQLLQELRDLEAAGMRVR